MLTFGAFKILSMHCTCVHASTYRLSCATRLEFKKPELMPPLNPLSMLIAIPLPINPASRLGAAVVVVEAGMLMSFAPADFIRVFLCSSKLVKATRLKGISLDGFSLVLNLRTCVPSDAALDSTSSSNGRGEEESRLIIAASVP